jgi:Ca2+-binding EF-hand superfamily protein
MLARNMFDLFSEVGIECAREEQDAVIELIKECDLNGDGFISFQEFLYILRRFADQE